MKKTIFEKLKERNQYPIVFIGAGIPKRYLEDYPSWLGLLEKLWKEVEIQEGFYEHLLLIREQVMEEWKGRDNVTDNEVEHEVNTRVASEIENRFNTLFRKGKITVDNLTAKEVYNSNISPFKKRVASIFSSMTFKKDMLKEYEEFKKMLSKSQVIMTTNYDALIEESLDIEENKLAKFIGEKGLFAPATGFAELYKLHGDYSDTESIILTKEDYERFDKNSVLITAKIISLLLYSPIIFLGYSMKDANIRRIIKNFTKSLSEKERTLLEDNLIIVEWNEEINELIEETENDSELGCRYKVIKTNDFSGIYREMECINQGAPPIEVRKYLHVIKKLIIEKGKEGELDTVLVNAGENLDEIIQNGFGNKKMVVAIGDEQLVYVMPNIATYMYSYINEETPKNLEAILRFILYQSGYIPWKKYVTKSNINDSKLVQYEKDALIKKMKRFSSMDKIMSTIKTANYDYTNVKDIINDNHKLYYECNCLIVNIRKLNLDEVKEYLLDKLKKCIENEERLDSNLRKLAAAYDLVKNEEII